MKNFLDELLEEVEQKEDQQTEVFIDLLLLRIKSLQDEIADNFSNADKEIEIIKNWALSKNTVLQERINLIEKQLEQFARSSDKKTIDLPNGILKIRKSPDKAEVVDLELFLKKATSDLITVIPEQIKPNLKGIKNFIKMTTKVPEGVKVIEGKDEFSYLIKTEDTNAGEKEAGAGVEQTGELRAVV
ncbi:MAG: hypothetical protein CMF23_17365 [Ignavibacteriae bacterium]|nr:hypothetical protein [Ignavibacteriota bacterium]